MDRTEHTGELARYPVVTRLLIAAGVPLGKNRILDIARSAGLRAADGRPYGNDALTAELPQALRQKQIERVDMGMVCAGGFANPLYAELAAVGEIGRAHV